MVKIMLDPGHAGDYYNASPVLTGYYESNMTWSLAGKLKSALEDFGFSVGLTRYDKYEDPSLIERGQRAAGYDLFLSLHSNAAGSEAPDAPWIIHYIPDGKTEVDEASRRAAEALGPVISRVMGISAPFYYTKGVDFDRDGNGHLDDEYYGVLFGAKSVGVPGVILEHGFHTNRYCAEWLSDEDNLTSLARAEAECLAQLFGVGGEDGMTAEERAMLLELKERVEKLEGGLDRVSEKYNWTLACPEWAQSTVHRLHQAGYLKGDESGQLRLTEQMLRMLVILERAGAL